MDMDYPSSREQHTQFHRQQRKNMNTKRELRHHLPHHTDRSHYPAGTVPAPHHQPSPKPRSNHDSPASFSPLSPRRVSTRHCERRRSGLWKQRSEKLRLKPMSTRNERRRKRSCRQKEKLRIGQEEWQRMDWRLEIVKESSCNNQTLTGSGIWKKRNSLIHIRLYAALFITGVNVRTHC